MSIIRGLFGAASANPVTAAPAAGTISGTERIGATQNGADVAIALPALAAYVVASISSAAPVELPALAIYQRGSRTGGAFGRGTATVAWTVTVVGVPGQALNVRLRDATAAGNPVLVASAQAAATTTLGANAVSVSVPCGPYWYFVDWQLGTGAWTPGTQKFAVGEVLAVAGQSLADRLMSNLTGASIASAGVTIPSLHSTYMTWTDSGGNGPATASWQPVSDSTTLGACFPAQLANRWLAGGVPCAVVGFAHGATSITSWQPGQADYLSLKALLGAIGPFGCFFWFQGHADSGMASATYQGYLGTLFTQLKADFPASAGMKVLISTIPDISSSQYGTDAQISTVRAGARAYVAANPSFASIVSMLNLPLVDGIHQTQAGNAAVADHIYRAMRGALGLDSAGDAGPYITGATRAAGSATIKVSVAQVGGTGLVASPDLATVVNQFTVFPAGTVANPYTISSVSIPSATEIDLVLSAAPADSVALGVRYRLMPDASAAVESAGIYDNNVADGLPQGRQVAIYVGEITAAAPVPAAGTTITVATPAAGTAGASLALSGSYTGTAPTGIGYAFDSGTTYTAATGFSASGGNWSATGTYPAAGSHTVTVQEANATGVTATSGSFTASAAAAGNASYLSGLPAVGPGNGVVPVAAYDATLLSGSAGAAITSIPDQSASGLALAVTGTATLGTVNSKNAVHFADSAYALNTAGAKAFVGLNTSDLTVLYVAKHAATSNGNQGVGFFLGTSDGQNDQFSFQTYNGSAVYLGRRVGGGASYVGNGSNSPTALTKEVARYTGSSGAMGMTQAGGTEATGTGSNGTAAFTAVGVGIEPNQNSAGVRDFVALIVWPARATDTQRDALLTWATNQFGS